MAMSRLDLPYSPNKICFTIDNVLSSKEYGNIIARSEEAGYKAALLNDVGKGKEILSPYKQRASDRCIVDDDKFVNVNLVFRRIENYIPRVYTDRTNGLKWELAGLNERLRILRYGKGHFFAPHRDSNYATSRTHK